MKVDIYTHILPPRYKAFMDSKSHAGPTGQDFEGLGVVRFKDNPSIWNLSERFRIMDKFPDVIQVPTLAGHIPSDVAEPAEALELSKRVNDEMAELVFRYPDRFAAGVAVVPLNDIDAALTELDRAINELHLRGVLMRVPINDKGPDQPEFMPLYEAMAGYDLPIWIHPQRRRDIPDYAAETGGSKYKVWALWGKVYETTVAMTRLVFSGVFQRHPNLKFITHHCGAMVPYFSGRIENTYDSPEPRQAAESNDKRVTAEKPLDDFRIFYNDTALVGNTSALMCGYDFFGADHILFGTDFPYDAQMGVLKNARTIAAIERMAIPDSDMKKIFTDNAKQICRLAVE